MNKPTKKQSNLPRVVLLGRANVGKSTLFNKMAEQYASMVSDVAGTTRDIKDAIVEWQNHTFELIDTGGLTTKHLVNQKGEPEDEIEAFLDKHIVKHALDALENADLILFVVDAQDEVMGDDSIITKWLKQHAKQPIVLVANKADNKTLLHATGGFYQLGIGDPVPVSATSGAGVGDLLDVITEHIPVVEITNNLQQTTDDEQQPIDDEDKEQEASSQMPDASSITAAIIGRPNVGKSSLLNAILGEERVIVSPQAHTTREPIDTELEYQGHTITLVDTAGIRRKARIKMGSMEKESVALSLKSMKRADIVILVVDGAGGLGKQDLKLAEEALKQRVAMLIVVNKIDLIAEQLREADHIKVKKAVQHTFNFIKWAPVMLLSAETGKNVHKVLDQLIEINENYQREVPAKDLNELMREFVSKRPAPKKRYAQSRPYVVGMRQFDTKPPHFEVTYKGKGMLPLTYLRYLERGLRERHSFEGTPIIMHQHHLKNDA